MRPSFSPIRTSNVEKLVLIYSYGLSVVDGFTAQLFVFGNKLLDLKNNY